MQKTNLNDFWFDLPDELIAQNPIENRADSKLLVFNKKSGEICHKHFFDLPDFLKPGDVIVVNIAKVRPVRLLGTKKCEKSSKNLEGARCEVLLTKKLSLTKYEALVKPGRRLKENAEIIFSSSLRCKILEETDFGGRVVEFISNGNLEAELDALGEMPLPQYIKKKSSDIMLQSLYRERYNTIYAKKDGSAAAPTAGLHFTPKILRQLKNKKIEICEILLNVGLGTFRPVKTQDITKHKMHSESYEISKSVAEKLNKALAENRRIICVGTTSLRAVESNFLENGKIVASKQETDIFIHNNFKFNVASGLITNFHLPGSTLVMLVAAFLGYNNFKKIYSEAIKQKYKFYSFGDANLYLK